jgi:DNA-binding NtrC family response regulator
VAKSRKMREVLDLALTVSRSDSNVVIEGETGTGKELIARAIHAHSSRSEGALIPVNCGALPENLLESELFGHARGAFTGAVEAKKGLLEEADRGTFFLDEVEEMPISTQVKLLRALQDGEVRRVGSNVSIRVNVRIIATTSRSLPDLIKGGRFREDLYYRLNVITIVIPSLRERREDILPLAEHFLLQCCRIMKKDVRSFSPKAVKVLLEHDWPGNVRELRNVVERAVILSGSEIITPESLGIIPSRAGSSRSEGQKREKLTLSELQKEHIIDVLNECSWNRKAAAEILGIGRSTLWRKMKKYGLEG